MRFIYVTVTILSLRASKLPREPPNTEPRTGILTSFDFEVNHSGEIWTQTKINPSMWGPPTNPSRSRPTKIPSPLSIKTTLAYPLSSPYPQHNTFTEEPFLASADKVLICLFATTAKICSSDLSNCHHWPESSKIRIRIPSYSWEFTIIFCSQGRV